MDTLGMGRFFCWRGKSGKMVLSLLLSAFALLLLCIFPRKDRLLCFFAMLLSSLGDYMLIDELEQDRMKRKIRHSFVQGGVFFMAAHVLYILTFYCRLKEGGGFLLPLNLGSKCGIGLLVILLVLFAVVCAVKKDFSKYPLFLAYVLLLTADCFMAFSYSAAAFSDSFLSVFASLGAFSFMISDLILGLNVIGGIQKFCPYLWWFYPIGQLLMIIAG